MKMNTTNKDVPHTVNYSGKWNHMAPQVRGGELGQVNLAATEDTAPLSHTRCPLHVGSAPSWPTQGIVRCQSLIDCFFVCFFVFFSWERGDNFSLATSSTVFWKLYIIILTSWFSGKAWFQVWTGLHKCSFSMLCIHILVFSLFFSILQSLQ